MSVTRTGVAATQWSPSQWENMISSRDACHVTRRNSSDPSAWGTRTRCRSLFPLIPIAPTFVAGRPPVGSPTKESSDDLGDFCERRDRGVTDVEGVQRFGVVIGGMTQNHESVTVIDEVGPFGSQVLLPVDLGARRPR